MYLEGGWTPPQDLPSRKPRVTKRDESMLTWLIVVVAILLTIAPVGGATIIQAVVEALGSG